MAEATSKTREMSRCDERAESGQVARDGARARRSCGAHCAKLSRQEACISKAAFLSSLVKNSNSSLTQPFASVYFSRASSQHPILKASLPSCFINFA